ncbi:polymer-forming cytoskeletal protein [Undibacterium arcticum]|uniref:Polymer-forming cytoskeletal protein n=1 Tax=Undibacterium arcticum TaxID=1762892 RepID=A0ABV7F8J9_9BURK
MQTSPSNSNVAQLPTPDSAAKQPMVSESISKTQAFALQQSAAAMRPAAQPTAQLFVTKEVEIGTTEKLIVNLEREQITSVISKSSELTGDIKTAEGYRIDGVLNGSLFSEATVIVSEGAMIVGSVTAKRVIVLGRIQGGILCHGQLILAKSAEVDGEIQYAEVITYQGCIIEGRMQKIR